MIAFIGVRISWLMLERKAVLALLACSAASRACAKVLFSAARSSKLRQVRCLSRIRRAMIKAEMAKTTPAKISRLFIMMSASE